MDIFAEKKLLIPTAEQVYLHFSYAGFIRRAFSAIIDSFVIALIEIVLFFALSLLIGLGVLVGESLWESTLDTNLTLILIVILVSFLLIVPFLYYFLQEWYLGGVTIGKLLFKIRVIRLDGVKIDVTSAFLRNLFRFVDWLPILYPYLVGAWALVFSKHQQRIGDMVAGTVVVVVPGRASAEDVKTLTMDLSAKPLSVILRPKAEGLALELLKEYFVRRERLDPKARVSILESISSVLKLSLPNDLEEAERRLSAFANRVHRV